MKKHNCLKFIALSVMIFFFGHTALAQTNANFSAPTTEGCAPLAINLQDASTSSDQITDWSWTNNGVFFSNEQNPIVLLTLPGLYDICLTVTASDGSTDQTCVNDFLEVFVNPVVSFTADVVSGCGPLTVNFTNTSTAGSSPITSVVWDFGGSCGIVAAGPGEVVTCTYSNAGSFQVTLLVEDANGCTGSNSIPGFIEVLASPDIDVEINPFDNCELPILVDVANNGNAADPVTYTWDFGNGNTTTIFDPAPISYDGVGPFVISVDALNTQTGCNSSLELSPPIEELSPLSFSFARTADCASPEIAFVDNSPGIPDAISWDFGDATSSSLSAPVHLFPSFGCYDVTMTRTLGSCTKSLTQQVCISAIDPSSINYSLTNTQSCVIPNTSDFAIVTNPGLNYEWDFGDGMTSTNASTSHTYTSFGNYDVVLTVTDDLGCDIAIPVDSVQLQPLEIAPGNVGTNGCTPLTINSNAIVNSFTPLTSINWQITDASGAVVFTSSIVNPSFTLTALGCYDVTIDAMNQDGCTFSYTWPAAYCVGSSPTPNFSFTPSTGCSSEPFNFTDLSTGNVDGWNWDFEGDGMVDDMTQNPSYEYSEVGCFNPVLTAFSFGCPSTVSLGPVCVEAPVADFSVEYSCEFPAMVSFVDAAELADSLAWDFGVAGIDTDTSSMTNPTYTFPTLGTFEVQQIAYNFSTGCSDTTVVEVILEVPQASFTIPQNQYCAPAMVPVTNTSVGASSYQWTITRDGEIDVVIVATTPTFDFSTPGNYSILLETEDDNTCTSSVLIDNILVGAPMAGFDFLLSGDCVPFDITFQDTSSNEVFTNVSWDWNFDNGAIVGSGANFQSTLDTAGLFQVELLVIDDFGCRDSVTHTIGLNEGAPIAFFVSETFGCEAIDIAFDNFSIGSGITYAWDFGDGSTSTDVSPQHNFANGSYEVCLTVSDNMCDNTYCESVFIQDVVAEFNVDPSYSGCHPSEVNFENNSTNAQDYLWDFGDGSGESNSTIASHIYSSAGVYDVELIAFGANPSCSDTLYLAEEVTILGPGGSVEFNLDDTCLPSNISISATTDRPYNMTIFYGDGNSEELLNVTSGVFMHEYATTTNDGFIPSVLLVEANNAQCFTTVTSPDTLFIAELDISYITDQQILCDSNRDVVFESTINSSSPYSVVWEFENGNPATSTSDDVVVNYSALGAHDVNLYVDNGICQDTILASSLIEVYDVAALQVSDAEVCLGDSVQINATGLFDYIYWDNVHVLTDDTIAMPLAFPEETLTLTATAGFGPCPALTATSIVTVNPIPSLEVDTDVVYFPGESVVLGPEALPANSMTYEWTPPQGLSCKDCPNPIYTMDSSAVYLLTYTDEVTGCVNEVEVEVGQFTQCPPRALSIPNAFSPNDDGNNDYFSVFGDFVTEIEAIRVYNRWGGVVFQTSNKADRWDGRLNGKLLNSGVYIYLVEYICPLDGALVQLKGDVTLLR